jgi:hypothetical protein
MRRRNLASAVVILLNYLEHLLLDYIVGFLDVDGIIATTCEIFDGRA